MPIPPILLNALLCEAFHRDPDNGKYHFLGTSTDLKFPSFPATLVRDNLFLAFIELNGSCQLKVRIVCAEEEGEPLYQTGGTIVVVDPLAVVQFVLPLADVRFSAAGEYRLQILAEEEVLSDRRLTVHLREGGSNLG